MINEQLLMFAGIAVLLTITPGADTMLVMRSVLAANWQAGLATNVGVCAGLLTHALCSALGLSLILVRSATAFAVVKWVGGCYLIFLGGQAIAQALQHRSASNHAITAIQRHSSKPIQQFFLNGFLTNLLNPKVALFYLAFLPQFIHPTQAPMHQSMLLGSIHLFFSFAWLTVVALFVGRLKHYLAHPKVKALLEAVTGVVLMGLGLKLVFEHE